ncbi:MAG TPA: bifunctional phosphopantothenoylcysteine decarboxylase/phosphopantothenate--cysteine ligase CoaBC [Nitrospiraceae bacterium]|nr:bifunctional phosphopantothenoylcysteine decarboxylase/phosphopantothenate--cysteine ligase CoaBC [Nitrospiraceae bacterium]
MDDSSPSLSGKRLVLGVTGSIAAYKAVGLLRLLVQEGATVSVAMTASATRFVTPLTFEILSRQQVSQDLFEAHHEMRHLTLPQEADAIVIAPATANMIAKAALGLADDLLSTMLLTSRCPLILAPAMDGDMWRHPAVVAHAEALRRRGALIIGPEEGPLASGRIGAGRMAAEQEILKAVTSVLCGTRDLAGRRLLVSAGPTQEPIDPVRFISNRSSGKMGYAIAAAASERGAQVVLVSGPTDLIPPARVEVVPVTTAEEMSKALLARLSWADTVVMAAAVADFRAKSPAARKLKKRERAWTSLELESTPDILTELAARRSGQILVGFAAETDDLLAHAREKLHAKGIDLVVANDVTVDGAGFGSDSNQVVLLDRTGRVTEWPLIPKRALADRLLDAVEQFRREASSPASRRQPPGV